MRKTLSLILAMTMVLGCLLLAACGANTASAAIGAINAKNGASILYGDANGDGEVNMKDALLIRRHIVDPTVSLDTVAADVDGDGDITMKDVLKVRKYIGHFIPALNPDTSEQPSTEPTETTTEPTSEPTEPTEPTAAPPTARTTVAESSDPVIYDRDVSAVLDLKSGAELHRVDITEALDIETAKYGIAERYIITVTCAANPRDFIYSILLGENGAEVWPDNNYDHSYKVGSSGGTTVCVLLGQEFAEVNDVPKTLFFWAEEKSSVLTISHIKIEVVRGNLQPTPTTTTKPTSATSATTRTTQPGDNRPTGEGAFTYVGDTPYITFRRYGDEGTLGTWWWYTDDATNATICDQYLDFLYMNGVDEIYFYGYYWCSKNKTGLHDFVQKANDKGMAISLIYDDAETITASGNSEMNRIATNYLNYCSAYPSDRMAGIHFDVEGVSRDNMVTNMISQFQAARDRGVYVAMDVNCKWTSSKTLNGVSGFMNIAAANLDCLSLMSYQDTANGIWNLANNKTANPFGAAKTYGTKIVLGVEVGHYSFNADSDEFAQEGKEICYTELAKVREKLIADHPTGGYGLAVHMVRDWYTLKNK